MSKEERFIDDIQRRLPDEVWCRARNEVLDSGNQGIWTMCLAAVDILAEFWRAEKCEE